MTAGAAKKTPPALRLFFALWPAAQEQQALSQASAACVAASGGRAIPAANLHVTLAFLGNVDPARLPRLRAAVQGLAGSSATSPGSLHLKFQTLEYWWRPQILCATADNASVDAASALAAGIRQATLAAGFAPDLKPFHAHVTVARKVAHAPSLAPLACVTCKCTAFALVASTTTGAAGPVYSVMESYPLDRSENARK